jgi:hypothetical protein
VKPIDKVKFHSVYKEHEVVFKLEDDSKPEDTVVQIVQKGWYMGDNILRPAKVVVSKKRNCQNHPNLLKRNNKNPMSLNQMMLRQRLKMPKIPKIPKKPRTPHTKDTKDAKSEPPKSTNCSIK